MISALSGVFEVATTNYAQDSGLISNGLNDLQNLCKLNSSFHIGEPVSRFGWTFFKIILKTSFVFGIEKKFSDMIKKTKGSKQEEKFTNFMQDFFESKGCKIKLKALDA